MFCYLVDCALTFGTYIRRGVVKFADSDLAREFNVHPKTIFNWKKALEARGRVWITERWNKNSFPSTVYNITAIVGQRELPLNVESQDGSLVEDQNFTSNRRRRQAVRHDSTTGKFVCRLHGQSGCVLCRAALPPRIYLEPSAAETLEKSQQNSHSRKILPSTTATDCHPPRQLVAAHNGNGLPSSSASNCHPERQPFAAGDGKPLPQSTATDCHPDRKTVADNKKTRDRDLSSDRGMGETLPTEKQFQAWIKSLDGMFPSRLRLTEQAISKKLALAKSPEAKAEWKRRLKIIQDRILGGPVPDEAPKQPRPVRAAAPSKPMTKEEVLTGARYLIENRKTHLLTDSHKAALKEAGISIPKR